MRAVEAAIFAAICSGTAMPPRRAEHLLSPTYPYAMTVTAFENLPIDGLPRVPPDTQMAAYKFGANCGPVSLAAVTGTFVYTLMRYFPEFPGRDHTTAADMKYALTQCGAKFHIENQGLPDIGVALIQLEGPWTRPGVPTIASLCYTHWIGCYRDYVFDLNVSDWLEREEWTACGANGWMSSVPRCTGWHVREAIEITPLPFQFSPYGRVPLRSARKASQH